MNEFQNETLPPHSLEIEEAIIGSILIKNDVVYELNLIPSDFYNLKNQKIFEAILSLVERRDKIDIISLEIELKGTILASKLAHCINRVATASNIKTYAKKIKELSYRRNLIKTSSELMTAAYEGDDVEQLKKILLDTGITDIAPETIKELSNGFADYYAEPIEYGIMTGIPKIDKLTSGMRAGELVTVTALPSVGKSNLVLNFASTAIRNGKKVLFINLEMDKNDVLSRLLAIHCGLDAWKIRNKAEGTEKVINALGELYETNFKLLTAYSITAEEITQQALIEQRKNGLDLLVVDYLNKIKGDREEKVKLENSVQTLKSCALRLRIPVIVPYQVTAVARREGRDPKLEDARGSTVIGDDAGLALAITNESKNEPNYRWLDNDVEKFHIHILKNRHGASGGYVPTNFNKHSLKFEPIDGS